MLDASKDISVFLPQLQNETVTSRRMNAESPISRNLFRRTIITVAVLKTKAIRI